MYTAKLTHILSAHSFLKNLSDARQPKLLLECLAETIVDVMAHSFHYVSWRWRSSRNNADIGNGFFSLSTFVILNAMAFKFDNALLYWLSAERKICPISRGKRPDENSGISGTNQITPGHVIKLYKKQHLHKT